jgi:hypothetical protein
MSPQSRAKSSGGTDTQDCQSTCGHTTAARTADKARLRDRLQQEQVQQVQDDDLVFSNQNHQLAH